MKLQTSIIARRDGTVRVSGKGAQRYVFQADEDGQLVADVDDDELVAHLLQQGTFWPVDPGDYDAATALSGVQTVGPDGGADGDDDDADGAGDGQPQEANTPPRPRRNPRKAR